MAILTKDGKPYKVFSQPNTQLKDQVSIEKEKLVFHNFGNAQTTTAEGNALLKSIPSKKIEEPKVKPEMPSSISNDAQEFLNAIKKEAKALKEEVPTAKEEINNSNVIIVYCNPMISKERKDDLYGEVRKPAKFGKKFTFEALLIDCTDFEISLYTKTKISEGSIIYPSKYKYDCGEKFAHYRWWKIKNTKEYNDGFILVGELTEDQLDFSD
ncbi:MAG: hypothetical protein DWQ19_11760 [Crenarchaeota archaeon]|nr:MAG: hypothetical protein DWQ19_11760 [Thermoproteota archaeon]